MEGYDRLDGCLEAGEEVEALDLFLPALFLPSTFLSLRGKSFHLGSYGPGHRSFIHSEAGTESAWKELLITNVNSN